MKERLRESSNKRKRGTPLVQGAELENKGEILTQALSHSRERERLGGKWYPTGKRAGS